MPLFPENTALFRQFVPVTLNFGMKPLLPYLEAVEMNVLTPNLGAALTAQLVELSSPPSLSQIQQSALFLARRVVANLGFSDYLPFAEVQIGDDGVTVSASTDRKPAFAYQTDRLMAQLAQTGWQAMDQLLAYLELNKTETFPLWPDSPYYEDYRSSLFTSAQQFSSYYPIQDRCLTFRALRPFITGIEETIVPARLAAIEAFRTVDMAAYTRLLKMLRRAVALQTMLDAVPNLSIEVNGTTLQLNYASQYGGANKYYQAPTPEQLDRLVATLTRQALSAWDSLDQAMVSLAPDPDPSADQSTLGLPFGDKIVCL